MSAARVEVAPGVIVRDMLTIDRAIDAFLARGFEETTRTRYSRILNRLADRLPDDWDVAKIREEHLLLFFSLYRHRARGTQAHAEAVISSFFGWLYRTRKIRTNPMGRVERTRRIPAADLDVTTVSSSDVPRLLLAARTGTELNTIALAVYLGPRRRALARLRLSDWDREQGLMRFREKGGKTIWKPVPDELARILAASFSSEPGAEGKHLGRPPGFDPYLIPPEGRLAKRGERDDRIIWRVVKRVAKRAGVEAHVHALRAAFAVYFLETHNRDAVALQELMGHESFETTRVYLRKLDRTVAMESVRDLSWLGQKGDSDDVDEPADPQKGRLLVGGSGTVPDHLEPARGRPGVPLDGTQAEELGSLESESAGAAHAAVPVSFPGTAADSESPQIADETYPSSRVMGAGGFEPPLPDHGGAEQPNKEHPGESLDEDLLDDARRRRERERQ